MTRTWAVYRFFDADGTLLYVGCSGAFVTRMEQHRGERDWFTEIALVQVEHHAKRDLGLAAEATAIRTESPRYNVCHPDAAQFLLRSAAS